MLTKRDKEEIRAIVQEELKAALYRTITIERGPRKQGDPKKAVREEEWHVLDFLATYLPLVEGALRGVQADVDKSKNRVAEYNERLGVVGRTLVGMEGAVMTFARLAERAKELGLLDGPGPKGLGAGGDDESGPG